MPRGLLLTAAVLLVMIPVPASIALGADEPSPAPLAWSPASIEQDWPAPVREEPVGDPVIIPFADGYLDYLDPQGDIESPDMPWIDIVHAEQGGCSNPDGVCVKLAAGVPPGLVVPSDPWIAYGLVFDTDLDGVADVRLGLDQVPAELRTDRTLSPSGGDGDNNVLRVWKTDLRTGVTETGVAGDWICQCGYPIDHDGDRGMKLYPGSYPTGDGPPGRRVRWPGADPGSLLRVGLGDPGRPGRGHGLRARCRVA